MTDGLTISGPRKTANLLNTFCGSAVPTCLVNGAMLAHAGITDTYLLALAVNQSGRLVTFDRRIAWQNVVGASSDSLWLLR